MDNRQKHKNITIAVLPFQVASEDRRTNILFAGFTEDLISNFSKFVGLSVISSYSSLQIKDIGNQAEIDQLGADYLIFGTVRQIQNRIRISIQLLGADHKNLVFAAQHDESMDSLLETQDKIIQQIVSVLQEKINYNLLSFSYEKKSVDRVAYENYLMGMNVLKQGTAQSDIEAREYFNEALKINPQYSLAYTGLSLSYFNFWSCQLWDRWEISQKGAHQYALKAVELDPNDYIALGVLGRTCIYLGEFEKAEHYVRKSLRMNANDASHLLRTSYSLLWLGYPNDAIQWYQKAVEINPFHDDVYFAYGATYHMEAGNFDTSIALSKKIGFGAWVDFPAIVAAAYYQLMDIDNMWRCWNAYLDKFESTIYNGKGSIQEEALDWLIIINPFQSFSYLHPLIEYIRSKYQILGTQKVVATGKNVQGTFQFDINLWTLSYQNESVVMKDAKGLHDIHLLISEPGKEYHCLDLMSSATENSSGIATTDTKAKVAYRNRLRELQHDIEEYRAIQHDEKVEELSKEYDSILTHLTSSLGLSGQSRKVGSTIEKARSAVTWRIRNSIKKIKHIHPSLGTHLSKSIKTGTYCSYVPEIQIDWSL